MSAQDRFGDNPTGLDAPSMDGFAITPADGSDLTVITRAIYVGGGGDLTVVMRSGAKLTFSAVPQGTILPVRASRVMATATTATLLIGML
jgi:hypothetical protein